MVHDLFATAHDVHHDRDDQQDYGLVLSNDCFPSMFLKEQFRMVCGDAWAPSVQGCWNNAGSRNKTHTVLYEKAGYG